MRTSTTVPIQHHAATLRAQSITILVNLWAFREAYRITRERAYLWHAEECLKQARILDNAARDLGCRLPE